MIGLGTSMTLCKLKKADVKPILAATFPSYRGRTFRLKLATSYHLENYWSGGTKHYVRAVKFDEAGEILVSDPHHATTNPFNIAAHKDIDIPEDVVLVEHCIFCGKDLGIRFIVNPNSNLIPKMLGEGA